MSGGLRECLNNLKSGQHLCSLYEDRDQQFSIVTPFIKNGLDNNEKCVYLAHENSPAEVKSFLRGKGVDVQRYINSGQLTISRAEDIYVKSGDFHPEDTIDFWKRNSGPTLSNRYKGVRLATEMTWALDKSSILAKLIEHEVKINSFSSNSPIIRLCQYNKGKFQEEVLLDIIRTHPFLISDERLCANFYYVSPDKFLVPKQGAKKELDRCLESLQNQFELPAIFHCYRSLEEEKRKVVDKFLNIILELDEDTQEAFAELFGKKRYGTFSLVFKAGGCIGFDWKSSHRR